MGCIGYEGGLRSRSLPITKKRVQLTEGKRTLVTTTWRDQPNVRVSSCMPSLRISKLSNIVIQMLEHIAATFEDSDLDTASAAAAVEDVLVGTADGKCLEMNFRHWPRACPRSRLRIRGWKNEDLTRLFMTHNTIDIPQSRSLPDH